jgi:hypothetical protein
MMSYYEWLSEGSAIHSVHKTETGIAIAAKDNSREGLKRFQPIAHAAFKHQTEEGYKLIPHQSDIFSGDLYDGMILYFG